MGSYLALTETDKTEMLTALGVSSVDELFSAVPEEVKVRELKIPSGLSEMELSVRFTALANENRVFPHMFRGAGAYRHYIPAAVKRITSNETFVTAYTPYQAEISQGILQSIFEYQSMICELTGMDASNASVYDGASAAAEALNMCLTSSKGLSGSKGLAGREKDRQSVLVSACAHPQVIQTIRTYCMGYGVTVTVVPRGNDGRTDSEALRKILSGANSNAGINTDPADRPAAFYVQNPNFFGLIEDVPSFAEITHSGGALLVAGGNPISLGLLESPGSQGADIAVGEGQPLGMPLAFGGPYLGFMACKTPLLRKLPGRIVGETTDSRGERAFVLTLQAREQHIRREKASSNICSNEAHCALTAAVYMAVMGEEGFAEAARQCHDKAVYAAREISGVPGYPMVYNGEFFHEFVTRSPDSAKTLDLLEKHGILGGYPLSPNELLWCVTEANTREEIDMLAKVLREGIK